MSLAELFQGIYGFSVAAMNSTIFTNSFLAMTYFVYAKTMDFFELMLYYATLPNSLLRSNSILVASFGFPIDGII